MIVSNQNVLEMVRKHAVVPVVAIDDPASAIPLADALIEGGLPVVEVTFRTEAAAQVISTMARERPTMVIGAGTVLSAENLRRAKDAGARFGVAPGVNPEVMAEASRLDFPFVPGVVTPSEIEAALSLGVKLLKFFPSEAFGGLKVIKALAAPFAHTGVRFMPTGGITPANLSDYLSAEVVACVGGTWIAPREAISEKKWALIRDNCRAAVELVRKVRG